MLINPLLRRSRRLLTSTISSILYIGFPKPHKHIKIDDEEQGLSPTTSKFYQNSPHAKAIKMLLLLLLSLSAILIPLAYTIYKPPPLLISYLQKKYPSIIFHLPLAPSQKLVALTIDDAPSQQTPALLDLLKKYNASATFFIIGSQVTSQHNGPEILRKIHAGGHEVGNHAGYDEASISLPLSELSRQISEVEAMLPANPSGRKYFRPGSGFFNNKMVEIVKGLGYQMALGSVYPHDPQIHSAKVNAKHVLSMVKSGSVIIMHDRRDYSAEQLGLILDGLEKGGWKVVNLGELIEIKERENGAMAVEV